MRRPRGDAGTSLVELLVAMTTGGVVLAAVLRVFVSLSHSATDVTAAISSTAEMRTAGEAVDRMLRVAVAPSTGVPAFATATATGMSFYASLDRSGRTSTTTTVPTRVTFAWDGTCLNQIRTPGPGYAVADEERTCVMRTGVAPSFAYFASSAPDAPVLAIPPGGFGTAARAGIRSVESTLTAGTAAAVTGQVVDRAVLTNLVTVTP